MSTNKNTQIIIDAQIWQTGDRMRGMGLFFSGLLAAMQVDEFGEMVFIVNSRLPELSKSHKRIVKSLKGRTISVPLFTKADNAEFIQSAEDNRRLLTDVIKDKIAGSFERVIYFMPSLFSSEIHPVFPNEGTVNILLFYDLIPFLYHKNYFPDHQGGARKDYSQRFREFYKADLFVADSQTAADDLQIYFGVDKSRIVPILGAPANRKDSKPRPPEMVNELSGGFVFMPSGDDFRKNNLRAAQAFATLRSGLKLVVTSRFSDGTQRMLKSVCPDIIFAGQVTDSEFLWFMDNARVVLFPPEYEGLGMPLLEAIERNAIVACSNIPVFLEISQDAFLFFDPKSVSDITDVLRRALRIDKGKYISKVQREYKAILGDFSWTKTARLFLSACEQAVSSESKRKLAIFMPSPVSYSAIGKYVFELHAELSRLFEIDYYYEDGLTNAEPTRPNILEYAAGYYKASTFRPEYAKRYDHVLYHLGNSEFHIDTIMNALRFPANAIIHDTKLGGIFDLLSRNAVIPPERRQLEALLDNAFSMDNANSLVSLATNQENIFCHSNFAHSALRPLAKSISSLALPVAVPSQYARNQKKVVVGFAGIISESKGINLVSEISKNKDINVRVFGFGVLGDSPLLQNLGDNVQVIKDLTDKDFQEALQQSDILINYRSNYHGETSLSTLEAMRYGAVVVVKDIGWYSELPDDVVVKVGYEHEIQKVVKKLLASPERRRAIAEKARDFLRKNHSHKQYSKILAERMR